jgi:hypothetical protein
VTTALPSPTRHWPGILGLVELRRGGEGIQARALELNPNYGNAQHWYGLFLSWLARHAEAIPHLRRAVEDSIP